MIYDSIWTIHLLQQINWIVIQFRILWNGIFSKFFQISEEDFLLPIPFKTSLTVNLWLFNFKFCTKHFSRITSSKYYIENLLISPIF
jgi:hypothetical protein